MSSKKLTCPFESAHQILSTRMDRHIIKCGRNHKMRLLAQASYRPTLLRCPFNSDHQFRTDEIDQYNMEGERRCMLVQFLLSNTSGATPVPNVQEYSESWDNCDVLPVMSTLAGNVQEDGENWDNCDAATYNPAAAIQGRALFLCPTGSPAERRAFRRANCARFKAIINKD